MTKKVIDLNGNPQTVPSSTTVKTVEGVHYLLTPAEKQREADRKSAYEAKQADYLTNHKYRTDRRKALGSIRKQLDMMYWDQVNGTSVWKDYVDAVKAQYPKP